MRPKARREQLLVQAVGADLVIYDQASNHAHCLNQTAAQVWERCDGETSPEAIGAAIGVNTDAVHLALERLAGANLLESAGGSRGKAVLALAVGAGVLLPVVESILAPTPAAAGSF